MSRFLARELFSSEDTGKVTATSTLCFPLRFSLSLSLSLSSFHVSVPSLALPFSRVIFSFFFFPLPFVAAAAISPPAFTARRPFSFQISVNRRITRRTSCSITRNRGFLRWLFSFETAVVSRSSRTTRGGVNADNESGSGN